MSNTFSAHKTPLEFAEWIIGERGQTWYDNLKLEAHQIRDKDYNKVREYLLAETEKLTE